MTWRHSSAPVAPLNLITVKSWPVSLFRVAPAAITSPLASTTTALAASGSREVEVAALPSITCRQKLLAGCVELDDREVLTCTQVFDLPAATTLPVASTATARAESGTEHTAAVEACLPGGRRRKEGKERPYQNDSLDDALHVLSLFCLPQRAEDNIVNDRCPAERTESCQAG